MLLFIFNIFNKNLPDKDNMTTKPNDQPKLLIFTGAGISAESGLSTFRDALGLWTQYDIDEVCNYTVFKKAKEDPAKREKIFEFYNKVKETILTVGPNDAHIQIAAWQKKYGKDRVKVFTANIDDLFEKAGCEEVVHVHGEIYHMHCAACSHKWHIGSDTYNSQDRCVKCNSRLTKPNVVFFYEPAPEYEHLYRAFKKRKDNDLVLYVGSSMSVIPPSSLLKNFNKDNNILVNLDSQNEDYYFNERYYGKATEQLKLIDEKIIKHHM